MTKIHTAFIGVSFRNGYRESPRICLYKQQFAVRLKVNKVKNFEIIHDHSLS